MKILVVSNTTWNNNNSFGNSFSNIFEGIENIEIANVFCRYGTVQNNVVKRYFQITEKSLIKNLMNNNYPSGREINYIKSEELSLNEQKTFDYARKKRWIIFFWIRDFIWRIGKWKSKELKNFLDDFKPDLLFMPIYYSSYLNDIVAFVKKYTNKPMLGYVSDDIYTLRQFSISPFYWIDRFLKRKKIRKNICSCEHLYVISDIQKQEYEKCFNIECKVLMKGISVFEKPAPENKNKILKLVYTGNIGENRFKQLSAIGQVLSEINAENKLIELDIYTLTPMSNRMKRTLNIPNSINIKGGISSAEVKKVQSSADILVHVESFDLKSRLAVKQSFSTKIVDYLSLGKPIFAVGPRNVASIDYLIKNDAALVATSKKEIYKILSLVLENKNILIKYGKKAHECGKLNHNLNKIQMDLYKDFEEIINESITN